MRFRRLIASLVLALPAAAMGQTGYSITGGMSNFDCTNHCDTPCNEFEVEIEGIHPEDVMHTYHNGNYGSPTITLSQDGAATIVDYRNPSHPTAVNTIEHFGISLRSMAPMGAIRVRWMVNGVSATVNGQVPAPGGGSSTPASQPVMPSITADMGFGSQGQDGVTCTVTNNDPSQSVWIKRRAKVSIGVVTLESLMTNNPVVTTTYQLDASPVLLPPGYTTVYTSDLIEAEENQSVVFSAQYFQDLFTNSGPFGGQTHAVGPELGNVMTATISGPQASCDSLRPFIQDQPIGATAPMGATVNLRVRAEGNDLDTTYRWMREGVDLPTNTAMFAGVTTDELSIEEVDSWSEGLYQVRVTNACGEVVSDSALVFVEGHNNPPPRPTVTCSADFDTSGATDPDDLFAFLDAWFADNGSTGAGIASDFDHNQTADPDDLFAFLDAWFAQTGACP
jgi:hypothetical protein